MQMQFHQFAFPKSEGILEGFFNILILLAEHISLKRNGY